MTTLAVTGADAVLTGVSAKYTAVATLTDGTPSTVTAAWVSSNSAVGTIDSAGRFEGRAHGSTTLTATFEGRSASKTVGVVNNYEGTWEGSYAIRACSATGDLTNHDGGWCEAGPGRIGTVQGILMTLAQSGNDLTEVTATIGAFRDTIKGAVRPDGHLTLSGTLTVRDFYYDDIVVETVQLGAWDTNLDGGGGMLGRWSEDFRFLRWRIGTAHTDNELIAMHRPPRMGRASAR